MCLTVSDASLKSCESLVREIAEPDARLRPVGHGDGGRRVMRGDGEGDVIAARGDGVVHDDAVFDRTAQLHRLLVGTEREELRRVADGGIVPVSGRGIRAAIRLEIVDTDFALR